ncbi:MAG: polyprenyl diphosphate synthase [Patescibacteria group bacterium]|nr:polyprenyl diphosphate synthase [Patescibacteria group bacterium]
MDKKNIKNLPDHVAVVPDGNRRWAKKRGLSPWEGHLAGAKNTEKLVRTAFDMGIRCFSLWGGSWSNLTERPKMEIKALFGIYERYFRKLIKDKEIYKNSVKVNIIGRWREISPKKCARTAEELIKATQNHCQYILNIFIAYNGTDEMLAAIKGIIKESRANKNLKINENLIKKHLWSGELPPVDFLIRTGSENDPHNSAGFMMWNCANSQLYFAKEFYPGFDEKKFTEAIKDFAKRQRRFGK